MKNKSFIILTTLFVISIALIINFYLRTENEVIMTSQNLNVKKYLGLDKYKYRKYTGKGVTIAIIDSGIKYHNDINKKNTIKFIDFVNNSEEPYDDYGHGTFIAGIIGASGKYKGIAPNVSVVIIKALDSEGKATSQNLIKALTWVLENKERYSIDIINLSFGITPLSNSEKDPILNLVEKLNKSGVLIIAASGNYGPSDNSVLTPAISSDVIAVGYTNNNYTYSLKDDKIAYKSSRNISSQIIKPDILTLGIDILSLDLDNNYTYDTGSSYAAAIVSGTSAILLEKYGSTDEVKNVLLSDANYVVYENSKKVIKQLYLK